ncbi:hypothetical protein ACC699_39400, partial [Rhizobium ruizarguesonis]
FSVDEALGMVYIPLVNQVPDQIGINRSDNVEKFSSSIVEHIDIALLGRADEGGNGRAVLIRQVDQRRLGRNVHVTEIVMHRL